MAMAWSSVGLGLLGLVLTMASAHADVASDWPQAGFDAAHSYSNRVEQQLGPASFRKLEPLWQQKLGQFYVSPVTQTRGLLTACSNLYGASGLEPADGSQRWALPRLPQLGCYGVVHDGSRLWVANNPEGQESYLATLGHGGGVRQIIPVAAPEGQLGLQVPVMWQGQLFVSFGRSGLRAINSTEGREIWRSETGWLNNPPSVRDGRVFVSTWAQGCCAQPDRPLLAYSAHSGELLWQQSTGQGDAWFSPLLLGDAVLSANSLGELRAFAAATGEPRWQVALGGYAAAPLVGIAASATVVAASNTRLQAHHLKDGALAWQFDFPKGISLASNLAHASGVLFFTVMDLDGAHRLVAVNARSGRPLGRVMHGLSGSYAQVSVAGGQVLVASNYGILQAYGLKP